MHPDASSDNERDLIELISRVPLQEVPKGLADRVMVNVEMTKRPILRVFWDAVYRPRSLSFRPIYAAAVIVLVVASFYLGRELQQPRVLPPSETTSMVMLDPEQLMNPATAHAIGRALLEADDHPRQALAYLRRASELDPDNPDLAYWEGIGYWTNGDQERERRSYQRGLNVDPENITLLINLGHSYLSDRRYTEALDVYQSILRLSPKESSATYNSGLIYRQLDMVSAEMDAWRAYLQDERSDTKAFRAVQRLNEYGDFSFRIYPIGPRKIIVDHQTLLDDSLPLRQRSKELSVIAGMLEQNETMVLEVVASVADDGEAARNLALAVRDMVELAGGAHLRDQVRLSWFDRPEPIIIRGHGETPVKLSEGVLLFSFFPGKAKEEVSI